MSKQKVQIQTRAQLLEALCNALDVQLITDEGIRHLVHMKAKACRWCGNKPLLYGKRASWKTMKASGLDQTIETLSAAVLWCGCGHSSLLHDEREAIERQDVRKAFKDNFLVNRLCDDWNGF